MQRYDLKRFLGEAPADLLQQYLVAHGIDGNIDWSAPKSDWAQYVFTAISNASPEVHRQIHCAFKGIHQLADAEGIGTILTEMRRRQVGRNAITALEQYTTPLGQAFWSYLNHPDIFAVARLFRSADLTQRWQRSCVPPVTPLPQDEAIQRLQSDLRAYYKENQDRGEGCEIWVHPRDSRCYWFACLQDYADEVLLCDDHHQLHAETLELAFTIVFIFDQQAGTLAITTKGDYEHVRDLQRLFGRAVFNEDIHGDMADEVYHLQRLLDRRYPLSLYPEDSVAAVHVQSIGIEFLGQRRRSVTVDVGSNGTAGGVHDMIESVSSGFQVPRDLLTVTQVSLYVTFRPVDGHQPKPQLIHLTPQYCSCTEGPFGKEIRNLLQRWGLYDSSSCNHPAPGD